MELVAKSFVFGHYSYCNHTAFKRHYCFREKKHQAINDISYTPSERLSLSQRPFPSIKLPGFSHAQTI